MTVPTFDVNRYIVSEYYNVFGISLAVIIIQYYNGYVVIIFMTSSLLSVCHGTISRVLGNGFYFGIHTYIIWSSCSSVLLVDYLRMNNINNYFNIVVYRHFSFILSENRSVNGTHTRAGDTYDNVIISLSVASFSPATNNIDGCYSEIIIYYIMYTRRLTGSAGDQVICQKAYAKTK